jgi:diadenosine tetraphosphatase ApaH/serine/threonine PP2A family protein phosphatase
MAPLAILYDVHGNLPALEAVLADARDADAQRFLLGGDYALFGPFQPESVAALRALPQATWIRGNVDRWAANPGDLPEDDLLPRAVADCREALGSELADELGKLPEQVVIDGARYCHASPLSDMRSFLPDPGGDDEELLAGASEPRVVFGHTHLQFRRSGPGGVELLNPGSVGLPLDGDARAAYALVHDDGLIELRRVEYDRNVAIGGLQDRFGDVGWAQRSIRRLQTSRP